MPDVVFEGNKVALQCIIIPTKVSPSQPELTWQHNGKILNTTEQNFLDFNNNYIIEKVKLENAGAYTCSNDLASYTTTLIVFKPTRIQNWTSSYEVTPGNTLTIYCAVEGDDRLKIETEWYYEKNYQNPIKDDEHFSIKNRSLTIRNVSESDIGDYTCGVSTVVDGDYATIRVTLNEVPHAPVINEQFFKCHNSPQSAEIAWFPSVNYGPDIDNYTIYYNSAYTPDIWHIAKKGIPAKEMTTVLWGLKPNTRYAFRMTAHNKIGQSNPSEANLICETKPDVPYKNPDIVKVAGTEPNNLVISWKQLPRNEHSGPGLFYRVHWKRDIDHENWNIIDISDWKQGNLVISNQPTFVPYLVKVEAINSIGKSNVNAKEVRGYSGEGVPFERPEEIQLISKSSKSVNLRWERIPVEHFNGFYNGYKAKIWNEKGLKFWNDRGLRYEIPLVITENGTFTEIQLNSLRPATRYYVKISILNRRYDGPYSEEFEFHTAEDIPSRPSTFRVNDLNDTALILKWTEPEQTNGNLTGYNIYCDEIDDDDDDNNNNDDHEATKSDDTWQPQQPIFTLEPDMNETTISDLKPNTRYFVAISANTSAGEGER